MLILCLNKTLKMHGKRCINMKVSKSVKTTYRLEDHLAQQADFIKGKFITICLKENIRFKGKIGGQHDIYCEDVHVECGTCTLTTGTGEKIGLQHIKKILFTPGA